MIRRTRTDLSALWGKIKERLSVVEEMNGDVEN